MGDRNAPSNGYELDAPMPPKLSPGLGLACLDVYEQFKQLGDYPNEHETKLGLYSRSGESRPTTEDEMETVLIFSAICIGTAWGVVALGIIALSMRSAQISNDLGEP